MSIEVGDKVPNVTLRHVSAEGVEPIHTGEFFAGRKVVLFAVPGAFTGTCSKIHLPGYVQGAADLKARGADEIVCLAVNDAAVLAAWAEDQGVGDAVNMLSDGNAEFSGAMGLTQDLSAVGMGTRTKRFAMVIEDGVVKSLDIETGRDVTVSGAAACAARL